MHLRHFLHALLLSAALGCSPAGTELQCQIDSECASGSCLPNGTCAPDNGDSGTGGETSDGGGDEASGGDGATADQDSGTQDAADDSPSSVCSPNHDFVITRQETPLQAGLHATYLIAANVQWDTAGQPEAAGARSWDLSGDFAGDHHSMVETQALDGLWFAPDFPTATYASRLSDSEDLLGIFQVTDDSLLLLGIASPGDGLTRTKLTYDPAVVVLAFPVQEGSAWETTSTVSGLALGVASYYTEKYANQVDARGTMKTPFGTFEVLRIRVVLTRTVGMLPTTVRQYLFATECFGTVGSVASADNEQQTEFTDIKEVKRLSP